MESFTPTDLLGGLMDSQQKNGRDLLGQQKMDPRVAERRLRTLFLAIPKDLPARPEPRHVFDNVARASNPLPPKGTELLAVYRSVMAAAIATGRAEVIESTQHHILAFHDEVLAQALADSPLLGKVSFRDIACDALEETAEALTAIGRAGMTPGETDVAVREAGEAIRSLETYRERAARIPRRKLTLSS